MKANKQKSIILTFPTTTAAIAFEMNAKAAGIEGRLISMPRGISAGCGFAWRSEKSAEIQLDNFIKEHNPEFEERHELVL